MEEEKKEQPEEAKQAKPDKTIKEKRKSIRVKVPKKG